MHGIAELLNILFTLLELVILIDFIASWVPQSQGNKIISTIHSFIYPVLEPIRRVQDRLIPGLPIDFSPMVVLLIIDSLRKMILI